MGGLLDGYPRGPAYDEMFAADGLPHPHMRALYEALQTLTGDDLAQRAAARDRSFRDQGVTFSHAGEEWIFPLDLIPRLIPAAEWELVEAGVVQRVRALEAFLADVYGPAEVVRDGVVPRSLVTSSASFCRPAHGTRPANGVRIHLAGIDLVRDQAGVLRVLEDNLRVPSGMSYVIENRRTMARVFPGLFLEQWVRPVASYPARLLDALRRSAPAGVEQPTVVLLTPGVHNAAYFEHTFLARKMGIELVEGRDLFCHEHVLYMRSIGGKQRVDVVYRRVNDDFLDPVHFRADDPDVRAECLDRLDQLVIKPVEGSGGTGIVIGPHASDAELAAVRGRVLAEPRAWIAQELVLLSTSPAQLGDRLLPRHIDLRPFTVNDGEQIRVLPGGLTRVALQEGSLIVNSSQGGGSEDTWVLTSRPQLSPEVDGSAAFPAQTVPGTVPDRGPRDDQPQQ